MKKPAKSTDYTHESTFLSLGGDSVLDFCNTLVFHGDRKEDRLNSASDARHFWHDFFDTESQFTTKQFSELLSVRTELREAFKCIVDKSCDEDCFADLNEILKKHQFIFKIEMKNGNTKTFKAAVQSVHEDPMAPFIVELQRFLNELDETRLKKCNNPNCSHFFYDRSKNNLRAWCSMKTCGNIMKARAFHLRKKTEVEKD